MLSGLNDLKSLKLIHVTNKETKTFLFTFFHEIHAEHDSNLSAILFAGFLHSCAMRVKPQNISKVIRSSSVRKSHGRFHRFPEEE